MHRARRSALELRRDVGNARIAASEGDANVRRRSHQKDDYECQNRRRPEIAVPPEERRVTVVLPRGLQTTASSFRAQWPRGTMEIVAVEPIAGPDEAFLPSDVLSLLPQWLQDDFFAVLRYGKSLDRLLCRLALKTQTWCGFTLQVFDMLQSHISPGIVLERNNAGRRAENQHPSRNGQFDQHELEKMA